ncbi:MAG: hypothetical protein LQ352_006041 [Teloschistes flavicans]|nr:MAG: hypothetical protein LQ352_006041 [Teloschistes flavicans]
MSRSNVGTEMVPKTGDSGALVKALWTLLDPQQRTSLRDFTEHPMREVEQRFAALGNERDGLAMERQSLEERLSRANIHIAVSHETSKELAELKLQIRKLSEQNSKYRSIILQGSIDNTELPDDQIHNRFVELRGDVQRIVHKYYSAQGHVKLSKNNNRHFEEQKRFRDDLTGLQSESLQRYCLRAKLFDLLDEMLLSARSFGVGEWEEALGKFEKALHKSKSTSPVDLAEWRSRTIDCGDWLEQKSQWPGDTCQEILHFLEPQLSTTASKDLLNKSMRDLCDKAYSLSLLMRRNKKATFKTESYKDYTVVTSAIEAKINCQVFDGRSESDIVGSKIEMTIFGGLVKKPDLSSEATVVLEKSHVPARLYGGSGSPCSLFCAVMNAFWKALAMPTNSDSASLSSISITP